MFNAVASLWPVKHIWFSQWKLKLIQLFIAADWSSRVRETCSPGSDHQSANCLCLRRARLSPAEHWKWRSISVLQPIHRQAFLTAHLLSMRFVTSHWSPLGGFCSLYLSWQKNLAKTQAVMSFVLDRHQRSSQAPPLLSAQDVSWGEVGWGQSAAIYLI